MTQLIDSSASGSWVKQFLTGVRVYKTYFESDLRLFVRKWTTPTNKIVGFRLQNQETYQGMTSKPIKMIGYI